GMDEAIIDNQFTQLFSSTKDDDLTKIGKFGIGFVSVFALEPHTILVHTGRTGEYWEVCFHRDRSFTKTRMDTPVEGTQITLYLAGDFQRYEKLARDIPKTLRHWCNHSEIEITFEDRYNNRDFSPPQIINENFEVPGDCMQFVEHQGTEMVLSYTNEPIYGFYNRGLTLALTKAGDDILGYRHRRLGHIAFKIKSRYLEHTLARESVMRDENYEKAMTLLEEAADGALLSGLVDELERLAGLPSWDLQSMAYHGRLLDYLFREPVENLLAQRERSILRLVDGTVASIGGLYRVYRRDGRLLMAESSTKLTDKLHAADVPVLLGRLENSRQPTVFNASRHVLAKAFEGFAARTVVGRVQGVARLVSGLLGSEMGPTQTRRRAMASFVAPESVYLPVKIDEAPPEDIKVLLDEAARLLGKAGTGYRHLGSCEPTSPLSEPPFFVVAPRLGSLMAQPPPGLERKDNERLEAAVNRAHPHFEFIRRVAAGDPAMGAYFLAKALLLEEDRHLEEDGALMAAALPETAKQFETKGERR
ncbi:MAG: hypothetical protein ACNA8W_12405, partial [Bradymonadaceae bacterium]